MRFFLTSVVFVMICLSGAGKEKSDKLDFVTVDQLTYRYYLERKWDSLILTGKQALHQDIDYYYLRLRLGIAYYEKEAWYPAITHLKKARGFNSDDPIAASYLYYAYKFTGQDEAAGLIRNKMSAEARRVAEADDKPIESVHAEGGYVFSSAAHPGNLDHLMEQDSVYGEQDLYGDNTYGNLGVKFRLGKRMGLTISYSNLNFQKTKYIQWGQTDRHLTEIRDTLWQGVVPGEVYPGQLWLYEVPDPWVVYDTNFRYTVRQNQMYASFSVTPGNGFRISPAFHYIDVSYPMTQVSYRFDTVTYPWYYSSYDDSLYVSSFRQLVYSFNQKDTSFANYLVSLRVGRDFGRFNAGLTGSWSNLNGKTQLQAEGSLTCFPLGTSNFYSTTTLAGFSQDGAARWLASQVLGTKVFNWLWAEGNFHWGDYTNANIYNGSIVYNSTDAMDFRTGGVVTLLAGKHLRCSLVWQYMQKKSTQIYYVVQQDPDTGEVTEVPQTKSNPYHTNSLIATFTWKF